MLITVTGQIGVVVRMGSGMSEYYVSRERTKLREVKAIFALEHSISGGPGALVLVLILAQVPG